MARIEGSSTAQPLVSQDPEPAIASTPAQAPTSKPSKDSVACFDTRYTLDNPNASPTAQGPMKEQLKQAAAMSAWTGLAAQKAIGTTSEAFNAAALKQLEATPPDISAKTECTNYTSTLKGVSGQAAFEYFKQHPTDWFGASGITLHPPTAELKDGARVFLAEPGVTPPVFAPIEVHIDEAARTVRITTLDGHPLRGVNQFSFDQNASGDCELRQSSLFQLSSFAAEHGSKAMEAAQKAGIPGAQAPIERQHQIWERAHANVADHAKRR